MGVAEKIKEIEAEMARTQKNKATEHHLGSLKAKLAKLRAQLLEGESGGSSGPGEGFSVRRYGNARVALVGFPSVGKSTLLSMLTETESQDAAYEFTTLTCIPGVIHYKGTKIQLLDLPGIIEGAAQGRGRGKQVIAVAQSADLILMVLDAGKEKGNRHREILERELYSVGIRLNQRPADIYFKEKPGGGIKFNSTVSLTKLGDEPERVVRTVLKEYKINNCEILFREDATVDQLIDIIQGNRQYIRCLYIYNKIDVTTIEHIDGLSRQDHSLVISCSLELNLDYLLQRMWDELGLVRIYTRRKGSTPSFDDPIVLTAQRGGTSVQSACLHIHKDMIEHFKFANVWGTSTLYSPQRCGLAHVLHDEDVIQISVKTESEQRRDKNFVVKVQELYDKYHEQKKKKKKLKS
eukprot:TRINITY_DN9203_c0_g1_i1.p1 TRINITY_DN9203_c0_g1~~TRINITY_DN9203_c0_g1_i1.p1  ORF type:complete len:408 (-),score=97.49 TRINITY_DN9203_c0_g1_i1:9-1232(-)